jgi:hypothetical protein
VGEIHMDKGRVGEESKGKETDGCPLTPPTTCRALLIKQKGSNTSVMECNRMLWNTMEITQKDIDVNTKVVDIDYK